MALEFGSLQALLEQYELSRTVFVGGKGGVGKTSTAASLAIGLARSGRRSLLVSTDPAHSLLDVLGGKKKAHNGQNAGLDFIELVPERLAHQYLQRIKIHVAQFLAPKLLQRMERQIELAALAPGTLEAAVTEEIARLVSCAENAQYEHIIFDTAPSGHTLRLLQAPEVFSGWVDGLLTARARSRSLAEAAQGLGGLGSLSGNPKNPAQNPQKIERERKVVEVLEKRRKRLEALRGTLRRSHFLLVLNAEALPIEESLRVYGSLKQMRIPVLALVINRILPQINNRESQTTGDEADSHLKSFFAGQKQRESKYLAQISQKFPQKLPKVYQAMFEAARKGPGGSSLLQGAEALWRLFCG